MIDENILRNKIEKIEKERGCSVNFEKAKELIEKIEQRYKQRYKQGMTPRKFKNLVRVFRKILKLSSYDYSLVAFAYLGGNNKKNVQENKSTEHLQYHLAIR